MVPDNPSDKDKSLNTLKRVMEGSNETGESASEKGNRKFYITTAIDYVNSVPHLGHLYEKVCADILARWNRLMGRDVFFLTGTDENAAKNERAAREAGLDVKEFVDRNARRFQELCEAFNISNDDFIRTTEERHRKVTQMIFQKLFENRDIYKGSYRGYYCYGCEEFKTEKDLVDGKCPEHGREPDIIEEECYYFRLSKYEEPILKLIEENRFIVPEKRKQEIVSRIRMEGLKDLAVSRSRVTWGINVPFDPKHRIYVWVDALVNYISALGYPQGEKYKRYWPADVHLIGKGINWFHSVIWPAILMSCKIPLPKTILVHGYITIGGEKLSKTKGMVIDPFKLLEKYEVDAVRFFLAREIPFFEDGDFTEKALVERVNGELVGNIGNFIYRVVTMIWNMFDGKVPEPEKYLEDKECLRMVEAIKSAPDAVRKRLENYEIDRAIKEILDFSTECNRFLQVKEPWRTGDKDALFICINAIRTLAILLRPYLPGSSEKIWRMLKLEGTPEDYGWETAKELVKPGHVISKPEIVFKKI
ncbi:MAG: methionine--tRNA ligase [Thermoproteota archaeon]